MDASMWMLLYLSLCSAVVGVLSTIAAQLIWREVRDWRASNNSIEAEFGALLAWVRDVSVAASGAAGRRWEQRTVVRHRLRWRHRLPAWPVRRPVAVSDRPAVNPPSAAMDHKPVVDAIFAQVRYQGRVSPSVPFDQQIRDRNAALHALAEGLRSPASVEDTGWIPVVRESVS